MSHIFTIKQLTLFWDLVALDALLLDMVVILVQAEVETVTMLMSVMFFH
jgi:hypothetical protein